MYNKEKNTLDAECRTVSIIALIFQTIITRPIYSTYFYLSYYIKPFKS